LRDLNQKPIYESYADLQEHHGDSKDSSVLTDFLVDARDGKATLQL